MTYDTVLVDSVAVALRVVVSYVSQFMRSCCHLRKQTYNLAHCDGNGHARCQKRRSGVSWWGVVSKFLPTRLNIGVYVLTTGVLVAVTVWNSSAFRKYLQEMLLGPLTDITSSVVLLKYKVVAVVTVGLVKPCTQLQPEVIPVEPKLLSQEKALDDEEVTVACRLTFPGVPGVLVASHT